MPERSPTPRRAWLAGDLPVFGRAVGMGLLGLAVVAVVILVQNTGRPATPELRVFTAPPHLEIAAPTARLEPEPLTTELRHKGYHECYPHDPMGLGPYAPYRSVRLGRIAIPQKGGHTEDFGYDVVIHFHGHSAVRKTLVQVARGVAFVGVDRGIGSGPYAHDFEQPDAFPRLLRSIEGALRRHSGDERAHVRNLAISAWSAGYGAVNEILKHHADRVDAVILLDGLHAAWRRDRKRKDKSVNAVCDRAIYPTFDYARRAFAGEKIFIFSHSNVDPDLYPSTAATAALLLKQFGLEPQPAPDAAIGRFRQTSTVDVNGLHVWGFEGSDTFAHCAHVMLIARALHLIETEWDTPPMDRDVPPTPAPKLGRNRPGKSDGDESEPGSGHLVLESAESEPPRGSAK